MKRKVMDRLLQIESEQPHFRGAFPRDIVTYEMEKTINHLVACVDAVDNNDFGFVSNYKDGRDPKKVKQINDEYNAALAIKIDLIKLNALLNKFAGNSSDLYASRISREIRRALDACVRKGYNEPVLSILEILSDVGDRLDNIPELPFDDVQEYFRQVMGNYAKKEMYGDKSKYFNVSDFFGGEFGYSKHLDNINTGRNDAISDIRKRESNRNCLMSDIVDGRFGIVHAYDKVLIKELYNYYEHVKASGVSHPKTELLRSRDNM